MREPKSKVPLSYRTPGSPNVRGGQESLRLRDSRRPPTRALPSERDPVDSRFSFRHSSREAQGDRGTPERPQHSPRTAELSQRVTFSPVSQQSQANAEPTTSNTDDSDNESSSAESHNSKRSSKSFQSGSLIPEEQSKVPQGSIPTKQWLAEWRAIRAKIKLKPVLGPSGIALDLDTEEDKIGLPEKYEHSLDIKVASGATDKSIAQLDKSFCLSLSAHRGILTSPRSGLWTPGLGAVKREVVDCGRYDLDHEFLTEFPCLDPKGKSYIFIQRIPGYTLKEHLSRCERQALMNRLAEPNLRKIDICLSTNMGGGQWKFLSEQHAFHDCKSTVSLLSLLAISVGIQVLSDLFVELTALSPLSVMGELLPFARKPLATVYDIRVS